MTLHLELGSTQKKRGQGEEKSRPLLGRAAADLQIGDTRTRTLARVLGSVKGDYGHEAGE